MFLEQICPGQVNSQLHAVDTFVWQCERYLAYATGAKVVIYTDAAILVQSIEVWKHLSDGEPQTQQKLVAAVAGNSNTGQLAIAYGTCVGIYSYSLKETNSLGGDITKASWTLDIKIDTRGPITCLDWGFDDHLLVAGVKVSLWQLKEDKEKESLNWERIWETSLANQAILAKFEPRSTMFATLGQSENYVTLWHEARGAGSPGAHYESMTLPHPRHVTHFIWRKNPNSKMKGDCTLFTMACDGIGRLWSPLDITKPHILRMCAVIDPSQSLVTSESENGSVTRVVNAHEEDFSPIHYIMCDELQESMHTRPYNHQSGHSRINHCIQRVRALIRDTPDLLFRVQPDGSLTLWGVQHLNTFPRRIPRVFVVLRVAQAVDPTDYAYFLNPVHVLHDYSHIQSASIIKPAELSLIARNPHGQMRSYSLNLLDFLDSTPFPPRLHLKHVWLGHRQPIVAIEQAQRSQICTIASNGEVNIWKYGFHQVDGNSTTQLQLACSLHVDTDSLLAVPLDQDRHLAVYDGKHLRLYAYDNKDCHMVHHTTCESGEMTYGPLSSLHVYTLDNRDNAACLLMGVSKSEKKVYTWKVQFTEESPDVQQIVFCGVQSFDWNSEPDVVVSSDRWFTNTSSALFHQLGSDAGGLPAVIVSMGSNVICYQIDQKSDADYLWRELYTIETGLSNISCIRCVGNLLSIVSESEAGAARRLSIWMDIRTNVQPALRDALDFKKPITDIRWNVSSDGQFILAVAFSHEVAIFGEKRASTIDGELHSWIQYAEFQVETPEAVVGLNWIDYGVLAVAAGNQLRCYLKWLTPSDHISKDSIVNPQLEPMSSIYDESYDKNGPLPFYHPNHLMHYVMWGKLEVVNAVLLSLYRFLRRLTDDERAEVNHVPPFCLSTILKLQDVNEKKVTEKSQYNMLFDDAVETDGFMDTDLDDIRPLSTSETKYLTSCLEHCKLPTLSENERMHLIAIVDILVDISRQGESLDANGARFAALVENHFHLNNILPPEQRKEELRSRDLVWALHSQSQDLLLERCVNLCGGRMLWKDAKALGIFLWLQKPEVVSEQMANIARNTYLAKDVKDPVECTLFYLALRKKQLLQSLWRTATHHKEHGIMIKFLANDFTQERWQRAAAKNAFALLGKQRYEYAAAFFLLADKLKDAVSVILKNLKDYQLAIAICRVYGGDHSPLLQDILRNNVLPMAIQNNDRWLVSISFWLLDRTRDAIRAIVVPLTHFSSVEGTSSTPSGDNAEDTAADVNDPNLFILYQHLKNHLRRQGRQELNVSYTLEERFWLNVSYAYERLGCPLLALYILTHFKPKKPAFVPAEGSTKPSTQDRAIDLFADELEPSRAADLFADDDNDIFAELNSNKLIDIFAEGEPSISRAEDLFAKSDTNGDSAEANKQIIANDDSITRETPESDGLEVYKALLVIRLLQTVFHGAAALYDDEVSHDVFYSSGYRKALARLYNDLANLGESVRIPSSILSRLLMEKSVELDVFDLYLPMVDEQPSLLFDKQCFLQGFKSGCFQVFSMALRQQEFGYADLALIERWTENVMKTFSIWSAYQKHEPIPAFSIEKVAFNAYLALVLVTLEQRHLEKSWTLLENLPEFLESLASQEALCNFFSKIRKSEAKMVEMDAEDFETFSDDSLFGYNMDEEVYKPFVDYRDKSPGANLLEVASLNYVLSILEGFLRTIDSNPGLTGNLMDFIWTTVLDALAYRAHRLKLALIGQLNNSLTRRNALRQLKTLRQKKYWHSIKTLQTPERLLPFINFAPPDINILPERSEHVSQMVYHTPTTAHAFAFSSTCSDTVAVCIKSEIQEIDLSGVDQYSPPMLRSASASSSGVLHHDNHNRHHHHGHRNADSYPDTEEEMDDIVSYETETDASSAKHVRSPHQTKSHHSFAGQGRTPTGSVAASPASVRLTDDQHKPTPSLSFDNLQDALKRSLGIHKDSLAGSESTRSTAGASSVDSGPEMITLKRPFSATCAEAHPQYPFYITGCEVYNNSNPSVLLWQFGQEREIASYYGCHGKATRVHFDRFGQKFGAGDTSGGLLFWRFDSHAHSSQPYYSLPSCHSKATRDFTFLDSSTLIASAGTSVAMGRRKDHVCLWDLLLPPSEANISSLPVHDSGAYAIAYDAQRHLLYSGGKRGDIAVSDIRQLSVVHTFTAHSARIRSIALDLENRTLITGSVDGELKIWDTSNHHQQVQVYDIQPRNRFLSAGLNRFTLKAYGVTQIQIDNGYVYTSGSAGIIRCPTFRATDAQ